MILYTPEIFVEGFSISHVQILDPSVVESDTFSGDMYGVRSAAIKANVDTVEEMSNDIAISSWSNISTLDIEVEAGYISFQMMARLNWHPATIEGLAPRTVREKVALYPNGFRNTGYVSMAFRLPARDEFGNPMYMDFMLYKVKMQPIEFGDIKYKTGMSVNYAAKAFLSTTDEDGNSLDRPAFGYLLAAGTDGPYVSAYSPPNIVGYDDPPLATYGP